LPERFISFQSSWAEAYIVTPETPMSVVAGFPFPTRRDNTVFLTTDRLVPNGRVATNKVDRAFDANKAQLAKSILWRLVEHALAEVDQGDRGGVSAVGVSDPSAADHSRRRVAEPSSLMALSLTGRRSTALIRR
jgi:hypothetical protein